MPVDLSRYRLVVFDLDGTLYHQGQVRRGMLADLLLLGGAPGRLARLRILGRFRRLRETLAVTAPRDFDAPLFARLAAETGRSEAELRSLVAEWIEQRPLRRLGPARVAGAQELFGQLRERGTAVAVWSDYPAEEKLAALGLAADHTLWAGIPDINALKPDPGGLLWAMESAGAGPDETLMVGDRLTHDGAAASAAKVDFLLRADRLPRQLGPRQYHVRDFRPLLRQTAA